MTIELFKKQWNTSTQRNSYSFRRQVRFEINNLPITKKDVIKHFTALGLHFHLFLYGNTKMSIKICYMSRKAKYSIKNY